MGWLHPVSVLCTIIDVKKKLFIIVKRDRTKLVSFTRDTLLPSDGSTQDQPHEAVQQFNSRGRKTGPPPRLRLLLMRVCVC